MPHIRHHLASLSAMNSYISVRPTDAPIMLDSVIIQQGVGTPVEYFTHKDGSISLLAEPKTVN